MLPLSPSILIEGQTDKHQFNSKKSKLQHVKTVNGIAMGESRKATNYTPANEETPKIQSPLIEQTESHVVVGLFLFLLFLFYLGSSSRGRSLGSSYWCSNDKLARVLQNRTHRITLDGQQSNSLQHTNPENSI